MGNGNIDPYKYIDYMTSSLDRGHRHALGTYTVAPGAIPLADVETRPRTTSARSGPIQEPPDDGFDWYRRYTTDMYTVGVSCPPHGTAAPSNNASLKTNGWELRRLARQLQTGRQGVPLRRQGDGLGPVYVVTNTSTPRATSTTITKAWKLGEIWGYRVEVFFRDQDDIDFHATQSFLHPPTR